MLRTVAWKVRTLILSVFFICALLFSAFIYYGMVSHEVTALSSSKAEVNNFSVSDKIIKNVKSYRFVEAKKNLTSNETFLARIEGFSDLEQSLTQAQVLPKYEQLLEVIQSKSLKFKDYIRGRSQTIERQLADLIKKIEVERFSKDRDFDFHKFISSRFDKIERISNNVAISKATKREISLYLENYTKEMDLLAKVVEAKKTTSEESYKFLENFKSFAGNLKAIIAKKNELLKIIELGCFIAMGLTCFGLIGLFLLSLLGGGKTLKKLNREVEAWLVDFSRSLFEKNTSIIDFESDELQRNLEALVDKYGQLQTIGELVESKLPFSALVIHNNGQIIWGNRSFERLSEGLGAEKLSDLWRIDDEIWLNDHQVEGISEFKADEQKYEYFAVPLRKHDKYFIVFSPLARVVESQNKLLDENLAPINEGLEKVLSHQFQVKTSEWKKYPERIQHALEKIIAVDSMMKSQHEKDEKRLEIVLNDLHKAQEEKAKAVNSVEEVQSRLDSFREGLRLMKQYYVSMVEKQDKASSILVNSVEQHDKAMGLTAKVLDRNKFKLTQSIDSLEKLGGILEEKMGQQGDITFSKLSLFASEVEKNIYNLIEAQSLFENEFSQFHGLKTNDYEQLSDELGFIDKNFIELMGQLYQDLVHLNYRINGDKSHRRPSENV